LEKGRYNTEKLQQLLDKSSLTNEDKLWLLNYLESNDDAALRELMQEKFRQDTSFAIAHEKAEKLLSQIHEKITPSKPKGKLFFVSNRKWMAVAAAVFVCMGSAIFLLNNTHFFTHKNIAANTNNAIRNDAAPGKNGAILRLSNGNTIVLDSINDGLLAMQGNVQVEKKDGMVSYKGSNDQVLYNDIITEQGKQWAMTLPDGSKVWLNAASSIHYPLSFKGNERLVEVTGEAYFEVVHNAKQPFRAKVGDQIIEDLGTHFNINAYNNENAIRTTLIEGALKVTKANNSVVLTPGQQTVSTKDNTRLKIENPNVNDVIAWKNGFFAFRNADITTIMRQLARWYNVEVKYEGAIPDQEFSGKIDRNLSLAQVLKILTEAKVHFKIEDGKRIMILP
jgi:ferric-dicitrate binding protein FerR (iron transport regulator)